VSKIIATAEAENRGERYATKVSVHQHVLVSDELPEFGGKDLGPSPGDYVCIALASCTVMTLRMYADRKQWKVDDIKVKVNLVKGTDMGSGKNTFYCDVTVTGELDETQYKRLMEIARACPIHRLLCKPSDVVVVME
jgi:putative redox protein